MGLFGSRYRTQVATQVQRVIEDKMLPDAIKQGTVHALMDKSSQTTEYVMDELVTGMATKADQFYKYGRKRYTYGLPSGDSLSSITGQDTVKAAVQADVGPVESISYYKLGAANLIHLGWLKLVRDYGYDSSTNKLTVAGQVVYLSNMQPVMVESNFNEIANGSMDVWGTPPHAGYSPDRKLLPTSGIKEMPAFLVDGSVTEDYILVTYAWEVEVHNAVGGQDIVSTEVKTGTLKLTTTEIDVNASYFQVRFMQNNRAGYWMYKLNSNEKPNIEAIFDAAPNSAGTFFPWAYFRYDKKKENSDKTTSAYKTTKTMLNKLGMDYDQIADNINDNPDIKDVEQAILMMGVPAKTDNQIEIKYLFDFFTKMYISADSQGGAASQSKSPVIRALFGNPLNKTTIIMRDKRFKMALSFDSIIKRRVAGTIGKIGTHGCGTNINNETHKVYNMFGSEINWYSVTPTHYYRRQITETVYEELLVINLKMTYYIWGDYTVTADDNDDILLVPLDRSITNDYQLLEKEELYARSLQYIFNSRVTTKLKWYQTGIFRVFMVVVAIVIMVYNIAAGVKALAAAVAAGATLTAIATMILMAALKYIVVTVALKLFVKIVGVRFAFITAIVAAIYGVYDGIEAGSLATAPWASTLLSVTSGLTKAIGTEISKEMDALRGEALSFEKYKNEKTELLEKAQDLLDGSVRLDPMIIWGETPDEFYQRTVHSGNIGIVGIEAVSSFVEMSLTLPKLQTTIGELYV